MALVTEGYEVQITAIDNGGNRVVKTYQCDPVTVPDFATAQTARLSIRSAFEGVSDMEVVGTRLTEVQYENAIVYPASLVEAENKASLTCQILGQNKKANLKIPAPKSTLFNGDEGEAANVINVKEPLLITYVGNFGATGYFLVSDGEKIDVAVNTSGIVKGKRISAKNNNG